MRVTNKTETITERTDKRERTDVNATNGEENQVRRTKMGEEKKAEKEGLENSNKCGERREE